MTYRDRVIACPRCGVELRRHTTHDTWRCGKCDGVLTGTGELAQALVKVAPHLVLDGRVSGVAMLGRRTVAPLLACPACGDDLEPVFLGGVDIDRCAHDELVWFDGGELGLVLDIAREQEHGHEQSWLRRMFELWFG